MSKYGFNGRWLFKIRYNSRIGYEDTCKIVLKLQAENAELKRDINVYENALKKIEVDSGIALLGDDQHYNKPLK